MRSAKLAVSLVCFLATGVGIAVSIGLGWLWFDGSPEYREQLKPELLKLFIVSAAISLAAILLPLWLVRRRINHPVAQLADSLAEKRISGRDLQPIASPNEDSEYQRVVSELNLLIRASKETQTRLDHYAAKVAHELRGPITLLQLQLDYASKDLDPQFVDAMTAHIRRLTQYVDTALYIAKVAENKIRPEKTRRRIADVVREIAEAYGLQALGQQRKLTLILSTDQEAQLDEKILGLILHNLLSNAALHGVGELRLLLRRSQDSATLFVLNRVRSKVNAEAGTGIGLRTVTVLAKAHKFRFRSRRLFNSYGAVLRIPAIPAEDAPPAKPCQIPD